MNHTGANPPKKPKSKIVAVIPARFASTRLPGKALLEIAGKPMICWVVERVLRSTTIGRVIVATDDERIRDVVQSAGHEAVMTRADHLSGTDRVAEVAEHLDEAEIIVNVQGDEPMIAPETIDRAIAAVEEEDNAKDGGKAGMATTWEPIESAIDVLNPDVVKIVVGDDGRAVYFSRGPVPYPRNAAQKYGSIEAALVNEPGLLAQFRKHTGLYVYKRNVLLAFTRWPQSPLEQLESLEQLRALERGVIIKAVQASSASIGVDNLQDLERVRSMMEKESFELWL